MFFPRLALVFFAQNKRFTRPVVLLFNKFGNLSVYYIWNIQAFNFSLVLYWKYFGTSQFEFETVELL